LSPQLKSRKNNQVREGDFRLLDFLRKLENKLLGIRKGFGVEADLLRIAKSTDSRPLYTHAIPIFGLLVFLCFYGLLIFAQEHLLNFGGMLLRVFLFDYTIFLIAALSGLDACRRWRNSSTRIEELSLSPLMPSIVGRSLIIGPLRKWLHAIFLFGVIEMLVPILILYSAYNIVDASGTDTMTTGLMGFLVFLALVFGPLSFAWFHYESAHLAHWLFSQHALPRLKLLNVSIQNFITINIIVAVLSALGSAITFIFLLFVVVIFLIIASAVNTYGYGGEFLDLFGSYIGWYVASIPAALLIAWLKRMIISDYEKKFTRSWLCYQWWGAGELSQPNTYPTDFAHQSRLWTLHYLAEEEKNKGVPTEKRRFTAMYKSALQNQNALSLNQYNRQQTSIPLAKQQGIPQAPQPNATGLSGQQFPSQQAHAPQGEAPPHQDGTSGGVNYNDPNRPDGRSQ